MAESEDGSDCAAQETSLSSLQGATSIEIVNICLAAGAISSIK